MVLFLLLLCLFSSYPARAQPASTEQSETDHSTFMLATGNTQTAAHYLSESSGKSHGGVILLPEVGRKVTQSGIINALRHSLADNHWHTLALDLDVTDSALSQQAIAAGIASLNQKGIFNVAIIGEGMGATQALLFAAALPPSDQAQQAFKKIRAVLMINANNHIPNSEVDTLAQINQLELPIFDAFYSSNRHEQELADARRKAARQLQQGLYQQVRLPQPNSVQSNQKNHITQRIRGWLDKSVAGFMVNR